MRRLIHAFEGRQAADVCLHRSQLALRLHTWIEGGGSVSLSAGFAAISGRQECGAVVEQADNEIDEQSGRPAWRR